MRIVFRLPKCVACIKIRLCGTVVIRAVVLFIAYFFVQLFKVRLERFDLCLNSSYLIFILAFLRLVKAFVKLIFFFIVLFFRFKQRVELGVIRRNDLSVCIIFLLISSCRKSCSCKKYTVLAELFFIFVPLGECFRFFELAFQLAYAVRAQSLKASS